MRRGRSWLDDQALYPDCDITLADIDGSGIVDDLDIEPFLWLLFGP